MRYSILEGDPKAIDPWIRLPPPKKRCPHTGLSRTSLLELVLGSRGQVPTVSLRKPGAIRGVRIIHLPSLQAYLVALAKAQAEQGVL